MSRDAEGRVTVRAVRLTEPLVIDGLLRDPIYSQVPAISDFVQQEPNEGEPATESTELWIFFDDTNLYVSARCLDSQPGRTIANELRRDGDSLNRNDNVHLVIDTFYDRRSGFALSDECAWRPWRPGSERRTHHQPRLEYRLGRQERADRPGLERRDCHPLQIAPLQGERSADLGLQLPAHGTLEERAIVSLRRPGLVRRSRHQQAVLGRHARRPRGPAARQESRNQAVRDIRS